VDETLSSRADRSFPPTWHCQTQLQDLYLGSLSWTSRTPRQQQQQQQSLVHLHLMHQQL
jgi:hypothetical protein